MSFLRLFRVAQPATPPTNSFRIYRNLTDNLLHILDDFGHDRVPVIGQAAALTAPSAALNTTETIVVGGATYPIPANSLRVGTTIRVILLGTCTSTVANTSTFRIRFGTAGTTADTAILTSPAITAAASGSTIAFRVILEFTILTLGASATFSGSITVINNGSTGILATSTFVGTFTAAAGNTTVASFLEASYVSSATTTTCTFNNAWFETVQP